MSQNPPPCRFSISCGTLGILAALAFTSSASAASVHQALAAYDSGKFWQAGELLKAMEDTDARAAGVTCELLVRKLLPPDDERGQKACDFAMREHDPHGLMWRGMAGTPGMATLGYPASEAISLGLLAEAAELGYPPAFGHLCEHFYRKAQFQKAVPFCKFAAAKDLPEGLYCFALMLLEGQGVVQDFRKGTMGLLLSAQLNHAPAFAKLADIARSGGYGAPKDATKAYAWLLLATAADPDSTDLATAKAALAQQIGEGNVAAAQKNAATWKLRPAPTSRDFYASK